MKKLVTAALILSSGTALASKARLEALGEDIYGSYFIKDNRNIFLNVAEINNHKDFATFEWGSTGNATPAAFPPGSNPNIDTDTNPISEGGYFASHGNKVYGAYFGYRSNTVSELRANAAALTNFAYNNQSIQDNTIDLFYGADTGVKWGAGLQYSSTKNDNATAGQGKSQEVGAARIGAIFGDTSAYGIISFANKATDFEGDEFEGKLGYQVGASHDMGDFTVFAQWKHISIEVDEVGSNNDPEADIDEIFVGVGKDHKLNANVTLFAKGQIFYKKQKIENGNGAGAQITVFNAAKDVKTTRLPISVGVEAKVNSWMALRGSVAHNVWSQVKNSGKKSTIASSNDINAGASFYLGDFTIDGLIGTGSNSVNNNIVNTSNEDGILNTDNLMTRVAMTYKF